MTDRKWHDPDCAAAGGFPQTCSCGFSQGEAAPERHMAEQQQSEWIEWRGGKRGEDESHIWEAGGAKLPATCDGIEQDAFEAWAASEQFVMDTHPLHWLFLNAETNAARKGWKAGLMHCRERVDAALSANPVPVDASGADIAEAAYKAGYSEGVEDATPEGERAYVDAVAQTEGWMQWRADVLPTLSHTAPVADAKAKEGGNANDVERRQAQTAMGLICVAETLAEAQTIAAAFLGGRRD